MITEHTRLITNEKLRGKIEHFLSNARQPVWDADDEEDSQWCIPEEEVYWMIVELIEEIKKLNDNQPDKTSLE